MAKAPKSTTVDLLHVAGPAKGRWRIGRHFTPEPTVLAIADLDEGEVAALISDPELVVIRAKAPAAEPEAEPEPDPPP